MTKPVIKLRGGAFYEVYVNDILLGVVSRDYNVWTAEKAEDGQCHRTRYGPGYIGRFTSKRDAIEAVVGSSYCQIDGNIFPSGLYILRVHNISVDINPVPGVSPAIIAKVHYNSLKATGKSTTSKPARASVMHIDLDSGEILCGGKVMQFINQAEMLKKIGIAIRDHLIQE